MRAMRILLASLIFLLALGIAGCVEVVEDTPSAPTSSKPQDFSDKYSANDTWLVYWYLCGSNLESEGAAASRDLQEMINAPLPPNVKVLIQAGGSNQWQNAFIQPDRTNIYLYDENGLHELETAAYRDMGAAETLASFLQYGENNFKVDHRVFIFWDHGGGSVFGLCQDERTGNSLSLNEVRDAFVSVYDANENNPPFEVVGFDTCLMATYEMANTLHGLTHYMVGSEELEPGNGWEYTGFLNALAKNPAMGGNALGKAICDSFYSGCEKVWTEDTVTLSVIDLSKLPALRVAYENFGREAFKLSAENPRQFFSNFGRNAKRAENYGGNTREKGYYDMVDIGDLAIRSSRLLPETSSTLIKAIDDAVVYKVNGVYRDKGNGISAFYPYDANNAVFNMYAGVNSAPMPQKYLYYHLLAGRLPAGSQELIAGGYAEMPVEPATERQTIFSIDSLEDIPIQIDKNNNAFVKLTPQQTEIIDNVLCNLAYVDEDEDLILYIGSDANVKLDWEKGIFQDNFNGTWLMLDGHPVYVEVSAVEDKYILYSIPIKLNGVRSDLEVAYQYKTSKYEILGARRTNRNGMPDKNLTKLKSGDQITTLHYGMTISGSDTDFTEVEVDTFAIGDNPKFADEKIADGEYLYCFEFVTPDNESATSEFINFTIRDGRIYTSQIEE